MATQVQLRRGNTTQTNAFTGALAEITIDTDKNTVVVHDGSTLGGTALAKEGNLTAIFVQANSSFDKANSANVLAQDAFNKANSANVLAQEAYDKANSVTQQGFVTITANGIDVVADANNDTLTLTSANGIAIYADATNDSILLNLSLTGVTSGTYGNTTHVSTVTTDSYGRLSSVTNTAIDFPVTSVAGVTGAVSNNDILNGIISVDGAGSNLDADLLDGLQGSSYANSDFAQASFDKANTADTLAQGAFDQANTANTLAQGAYDQANTGTTIATGAFDKANSANVLAQGAYDQANTANTLAQGAYNQANTSNTLAQGAFDKANSANVLAQNAYDSSNTKFSSSGGTISGDVTVSGNLIVIGEQVYANTETVLIKDNIITLNAAIDQSSAPSANAGLEIDRGSSANVYLLWNETSDKWQFTNDGTIYFNVADEGKLNSAFDLANTNSILAQGAYDQANTTNTIAAGSFNQANAAFDLANGTAGVANTDVTNISITDGTYGNSTHVPIVTLSANGRVNAISTVAITASDPSALAFAIALG